MSGMGSSPIYHVLGACKGQPVAAGLLLAQEFPNCGIDKVQVKYYYDVICVKLQARGPIVARQAILCGM